MTIHPAKEVSIGLLFAEKVTIASKFSDFTDVFLEKISKCIFKANQSK